MFNKKALIVNILVLMVLSCALMGQDKPNIVFVFADQYRAMATGYSHEDPVFTPNINALAEEGVVFTNAISSCPVCTPYRGMLITGKYPLRNGMTRNCSDLRIGLYLRPDSSAFGNAFKKNNYQTGYIGKWHLDDAQTAMELLGYSPDGTRGWDTYTPPGEKRQGFDFWHAYNAYDSHIAPHYWENTTEMIEPGKWSPQHEAEVAIDFIENRDVSKPFMLMWSINPPHPPVDQVPDMYTNYYDETDIFFTRKNVLFEGEGAEAPDKVENYFASVTGVDQQFGRLINYLKEEGLFENTIIVFTADHGEMMGSHGLMNKSQWYEEAINVPLVISYPAKLNPGVSKCLVSPVDYLPTLLALSGSEVPDVYDGKDLSHSVLDVNVCEQDTVFLAHYLGDFDSSPDDSWLDDGWRGIRTQDHTFVMVRKSDGFYCYLYDGVNDKFQMNPLIASGKGEAEEFEPYLTSLKRILNEMGDPFLREEQVYEEPYSLLDNPGFETGSLLGWNNWNNGITGDPELVCEGNYSAIIYGGKSGSIQTVVSLKPNTSYQLSVSAHVSSEGENATFLVKDFDGSGSKISTLLTATSYAEYTLEFITGSSPDAVSVSLYKAEETYGTVYADNFILIETGDKVSEIKLTPEDECRLLPVNGSYQVNAEIIPVTALDKSLQWIIIDGSGSATVDEKGLVYGISTGSIIVVARSSDGSTISDSVSLNVVTGDPELTEISIENVPATGEVLLGTRLNLTARFEPEFICDRRVKWSVENLDGKASISDQGLFIALSEGEVILRLQSEANPEINDEILLNLSLGNPRVYFVDASAGNDTNDGLSEDNPWKSLEKVNNSTFIPGDSILFKSGESWAGQLEIETNGVEGHPVVFSSYGSGAKPRIDGQGEKDYTIVLKNSNYTVADGFEVTNTGETIAGGRYGVMLLASNAGPVYQSRVYNMDVHQVNGDPVKGNGGGGGIVWRIEGDIPSRLVDGLIQGCHVYDCERNGIVGKSAYTSSVYQKKRDYYSLRMSIRENLIERIPGDAIVVLGCDSSVVEYNVCRDFTDDLPNVAGNAAAGIWPWNSLNTIIQHNEVSGHMASWDGQGFDSDWNCDGTIIQYNYSHDNAGGFVLICSKGDVGYNDNTVVRYNISVNDGYRTWGTGADFCPSIHIAGNTFNTRIYNNTIYSGPKPTSVEKQFISATNWNAWSNVTYIYNNIFYAAEPMEFSMESSENNAFNHNLYSAGTLLPPDHNPLMADPQFVNPGGSDTPENYKLNSYSLAHGRGLLIYDNGGRDFFGNVVSQVSTPSIGAFEGTILTVEQIPSPDPAKVKQFTLYPNPSDLSSVMVRPNVSGNSGKIILSTLNGQVIDSFQFNVIEQVPISIDLKGNKPGMYLITMQINSVSETQKFIKL